jgi:hypothetical protein
MLLSLRQLTVASSIVAVLGVALLCCNPHDVTGIDSGGGDAAADGGADASVPTHDAGDCVPKAGTQPVSLPGYPQVHLASDLPSGSCGDEGAVCSMGALASWSYCVDGGDVVPDAGGTLVACSLSGFECTCRDRIWSCKNVLVGASVCGCRF